MLKRTITYTDFDGNQRTEDFYFNLSKAEVVEMEMGVTGGLTQMIHRIVAAQDNKQVLDTIKSLILKAYGEKSPDGKRFIKNQDLRDSFVQTEAYSILFMELATDEQKSIDFVNAIIPKPEK